MRSVRYTLLTDGASDRALISVVDWLFREHLSGSVLLGQGQLAELGRVPNAPPLSDLPGRIRTAVDFYPCDVLSVHRDAEQRDGYAARRAEIEAAIREANVGLACIPVVPVRMTEAWLLSDESALRLAADRPGGTTPLAWPPAGRIERIDAKQTLFSLFRTAAGQTGRRRARVTPESRRARLASLIEDFAPLRCFESFRDLETDVQNFIKEVDATDVPG